MPQGCRRPADQPDILPQLLGAPSSVRRLLHIPDGQGLPGLVGLGAGDGVPRREVCLVGAHALSVHAPPAVGEHPVQDQLHPLGGRRVLLPLVVDDALGGVDDGVPGKPGLVHGLAQVGGGLGVLDGTVPLHRPLKALPHGLLQGEVRIGDQRLRRLPVVGVQLRVVELEGVDAPLPHALIAPPGDVLGRVNGEDPPLGVHPHGALLVGLEDRLLLLRRQAVQLHAAALPQNAVQPS